MAKRFSIRDDDPLSATGEGSQLYETAREGWRTRIETNTRMTCSAGAFHATVEARSYEGDDLVYSRGWTFDRERDLVQGAATGNIDRSIARTLTCTIAAQSGGNRGQGGLHMESKVRRLGRPGWPPAMGPARGAERLKAPA